MSYNTVEECDEYVATHFITGDASRVRWEGLSEEDKQVLLTRAYDIIESLPFTGRKTDPAQPHAFPRYPQKEIPQEVKHAECEQALVLSDAEKSQEFDDYRKMIQYGIQSYSIGNLSETLLTYNKNSVEIMFGLSSDSAKRSLLPWVSGGYRIG